MRRRSRNPSLPGFRDLHKQLAESIQVVCGCKKEKAEKIAHAYPTGMGLPHADVENFRALGLTPKQAQRMVASFRMVQTVSALHNLKGEVITKPNEAAQFIRAHTRHQDRESFIAVLLDPKARVIDIKIIATGSLDRVDIHPRELFRDAVRVGARSIIMAHNHPSGSPEPSEADLVLTQRMVEAGKQVGIPVLDHLIVGEDEVNSLAALGLMNYRL